ncbi:hypothetical protein B0A54_11861 [Friedmanniomyces endolithicus]|uniref:Uncharacterized protein n=1 Tax=Friedmanniomyces endolithicus TaxID=329885 RepID=A0A4U0ULG2_9PEZI|nr:hypothetical protein LTS09_014709 [Friedmanniomyces endolithicus]TKA36618.1 hypothetical protein B0A54_11861 [Friedmanniomyces endolithicus]
MSYNRHRHEQLRRLGVEQLPAIHTAPDWAEHRHAPHHPFNGDLPVRTMPVPGRRCPNCLSKGQTVWVIPGKHCPQCQTAVS